MLVDAALRTNDFSKIADVASAIDAAGYDGMYTVEGPHDAMFPLLLAAEHTERARLMTAIVVAFARSPMTLAQQAYDLNLASKGRFDLGLGTQIKPHIEKRFSMPWSQPADRMLEFVLALRAIWSSWHEGTKLEFRGEFYTHTLTTPFFNPGPSPYGVPRVFVAGVGPRMTEVAGEVADGFIIHPFSTEKFMRETTIPALQAGAATAKRSISDVEVAFQVMTIVAESDEELAQGRDALRARLAFYGSTPAYKVVLDAQGWGDLQPELNRLTKTGGWAEMSSLITDEMVDTFAVCGRPEEIGPLVKKRYGDVVQRIAIDTASPLAPERVARVLADLK